jgi:chromosomal replication initiation ATPase DnaA
MEGAIIRILAYRELSKKDVVDLRMAEQVTKDLFPDRAHRPIPVNTIRTEVCRFYNISHSELIGEQALSRHRVSSAGSDVSDQRAHRPVAA